jgi:hypothetical protein
VRDIIPKDDLPEFEQQWSNLHLGVSFQGTFRRFNSNGEEIRLMESYTPVEDNDGIIIKIFFLAVDITELVKSKKAVDISSEELNKANEKLKDNLKMITEEIVKLKKENQDQKDLEAAVMKKFESSADKKYYLWLQSLKNG